LKPIRVDENEKQFYSALIENDLTAWGENEVVRNHFPKLAEFTIPYHGSTTREGKSYIVLDNVLHNYRQPGMMDIKVGLPFNHQKPFLREGVGNLMGCYIHGVSCRSLVYLNHVNNYEGRQCTVDHFDRSVRRFLNQMSPQPQLIEKLRKLIHVVEELKGMRFASASLFFVFEQDTNGPLNPPALYFIDFERVILLDEKTPDRRVLKSLKHVLYCMRKAWEPHPPTIYLVRHGERYDYTDVEWAPKSTHPHDSPLSPVGDAQACDIADRLIGCKPHIIASSPFQRAIMTGEPLARRLNHSVAVEPGLAEFLCQKTRKKIPAFFSDVVTLSPWVDHAYKPYWPKLELETWDQVFERTKNTVNNLIEQCRGKGDLVIISHRSTLQTVMAALCPSFKEDTKLEYGGIAMLVQEPTGEWHVQTWNELAHLRNLVASPSSNPWRHIEGYYEDMDWNHYKSTGKMLTTEEINKLEQLKKQEEQLKNEVKAH